MELDVPGAVGESSTGSSGMGLGPFDDFNVGVGEAGWGEAMRVRFGDGASGSYTSVPVRCHCLS